MKKILSIITTILILSSSAYSAPWSSSSGTGTGDFVGPASSTDGNFVSFNGAGGKTGKDSGSKAADFLGASAKAADADKLDNHDSGYFQVDLGLTKGTMTDGKYCTYTASGTVLNCNSDGGGDGSGSMTYPGAGVANSTGSAWGTSYTVGTSANNLVQLDGSGKLPAVDGSALTGISGGVAGKVCKTITNPSDADNVLFDIASTRTITKISGIAVGGTSAVITLQDAGATGSGSTSIDDAITMDTDGANGGTISYAVHDGDIIKLDVGTVTGVVTQLMVCYE